LFLAYLEAKGTYYKAARAAGVSDDTVLRERRRDPEFDRRVDEARQLHADQLEEDLCPVTPRLLDPASAARYLGVSTWTVRDLEAGGHLQRVRLPLPGGKDLRKLLYDRADLDRLIEASKASG
jgi:hypothetical protein